MKIFLFYDEPSRINIVKYNRKKLIQNHKCLFILSISGVLVQHGEYQYEAPNGEVVKVQYTADGNLN